MACERRRLGRGTVVSYCPSCSRMCWIGSGVWRSALATGVALTGLGLAGCGVEVPGLADPGAAFCLDPFVPGDVQPADRAPADGELAGVDPVVDDPGAAAELVGGFGDADLPFCGRRWRGGQRARAGSPAQAGGLGDPLVAARLDFVVPGDAEPAVLAAAGGQPGRVGSLG